MVWLGWNPRVSTGMLWLCNLSVNYAEAKTDVVALVRRQGSDFWALANGIDIWFATWKTIDLQIKETFFGNINR